MKVNCFKLCFRIKVKDALNYATAGGGDNQENDGGPKLEPSYILSFVM